MLNYGMRYEHYGVQHNNNQQLDSNFYLWRGVDVLPDRAYRHSPSRTE